MGSYERHLVQPLQCNWVYVPRTGYALALLNFPFPALSAPWITPQISPWMGIHSTVLAAELCKKGNSAKSMHLKKKSLLLVIAVSWVKMRVKIICLFPSIAAFPHPIQSSAAEKLVHPSCL